MFSYCNPTHISGFLQSTTLRMEQTKYWQEQTSELSLWSGREQRYMYVCLPVCLPACLPVCLPVCLPGCLPGCLLVCSHVAVTFLHMYLCRGLPCSRLLWSPLPSMGPSWECRIFQMKFSSAKIGPHTYRLHGEWVWHIRLRYV